MKSRKDHLVELAAAALNGLFAGRTFEWGETVDTKQAAHHAVRAANDTLTALDASKPAQEAPVIPPGTWTPETIAAFNASRAVPAPASSALDAELFKALEAGSQCWMEVGKWEMPNNARRARALRAWYEHHKERRFWDGDASNEEHRRSDAAGATEPSSPAPVRCNSAPAAGGEAGTSTPDPERARLVKERDEACRATFGTDLQWYGGWSDDTLRQEAGCKVSNRSRRAELALREYDDAVEAARTVSKIAAEASGQREYDERKALQSELGPDCIVYSVQDDPVTKAALELADMVARHYANCSDDRVPYNLPENFWRGLLAYRRAVRERDAKKEVKS